MAGEPALPSDLVPRHRNPLRAYRNDRGWSLAEVGAAVGLGRADMLMVETGLRLITPAQQVALAGLLGIDPREIDYAVDHGKG